MNNYEVGKCQERIEKVLKLKNKYKRIYVPDDMPEKLKQSYTALSIVIDEVIRQEAMYMGSLADEYDE